MKKFAWFFPVSAGILWGSVGIFIRSLSGYGMDTATIVGSRTMISVILMLIGIAVIDTPVTGSSTSEPVTGVCPDSCESVF